MEKVRFGIIGCGGIAHCFARDIKFAPHAELVAVGSRSLDKAKSFAGEFDVPLAFGSYDELLATSDVDAVYLATPHSHHCEHGLTVLRAGKHLLCEKPVTVNAKEAELLIGEARKRSLFFGDAMWTRHFPVSAKIREWLSDEAFGKVVHARADFGFRGNFDPAHRLYNKALAGGALLDIGVYAAAFTSMAFNFRNSDSAVSPDSVIGSSALCPSGADDEDSAQLLYGSASASFRVTMRENLANSAYIAGENGIIFVPEHFWMPTEARLITTKGSEVFTSSPAGGGYEYETEAAALAILGGKLEFEVMRHSETLAIIRTLDALRAQAGVYYVNDERI